jgi:hypothetical protein
MQASLMLAPPAYARRAAAEAVLAAPGSPGITRLTQSRTALSSTSSTDMVAACRESERPGEQGMSFCPIGSPFIRSYR